MEERRSLVDVEVAPASNPPSTGPGCVVSAVTAVELSRYSSAPAMVNDYINGSSKYLFTFLDADGDLLNGSNQPRPRAGPRCRQTRSGTLIRSSARARGHVGVRECYPDCDRCLGVMIEDIERDRPN